MNIFYLTTRQPSLKTLFLSGLTHVAPSPQLSATSIDLLGHLLKDGPSLSLAPSLVLCKKKWGKKTEMGKKSVNGKPEQNRLKEIHQLLTNLSHPIVEGSDISKKVWLFPKLQPGGAKKRINAT